MMTVNMMKASTTGMVATRICHLSPLFSYCLQAFCGQAFCVSELDGTIMRSRLMITWQALIHDRYNDVKFGPVKRGT